MENRMQPIVALIIFSSLIIIGVYFLNIGKFQPNHFLMYLFAVLLAGLAFYGFDRLKEFDLRNMKLVLTEFKATKSEFESEVKELYETLAATNIALALDEQAFAADGYVDELIDKRNRAILLLRKIGKDEKEIRDISKKINLKIEKYLAGSVQSEVANKFISTDHADYEKKWFPFRDATTKIISEESELGVLRGKMEKAIKQFEIPFNMSVELEKINKYPK